MPDIHGHHVEGDEDGMKYLHSLDSDEARVIFDYARSHGHAEFEDHANRHNYTLTDKNGVYEVERRKSGGGWF